MPIKKGRQLSIKSVGIWFGSVILCGLAGYLFLSARWLVLVSSLAAGTILAQLSIRLFDVRKNLFEQVQFKWFLEHLLSDLSTGSTLEHAWAKAPERLSLLLPSRSRMLKDLKRIQGNLSANQPLDRLLEKWSRSLPTPQARGFVKALPAIRRAGGDACGFVRAQLQIMSDRIDLFQDLGTDTTQRRTEAIILVLMPPAMLQMVAASGLGDNLTSGSGLAAGMLFAYVLFLASSLLLLSILCSMMRVSSRQQSKPRSINLDYPWLQKPAALLVRLYRTVLPDTYYSNLIHILQMRARRHHLDKALIVQDHFKLKALLMIAALLPATSLAATNLQLVWLLLVLPAVLAGLHDQILIRQALERQLADQVEYPEFLNLCASLLMTGISLHKAMCIALLVREPGSSDFNIDLNRFEKQLDVGQTVQQALETLSADCPVHQVQSAIAAMIRYSLEGRPENLQILQMKTVECWSLHRRAIKKRLEQRSLALLVPMALDLLSVMVIVMLPAIVSIQGI